MKRLIAFAVMSVLAFASADARAEPSVVMIGDLAVTDLRARASSKGQKNGVVFMTIENSGPTPERLIAAAADIAHRVELHTHVMVDLEMKMRPVDGIDVPANGKVALRPGGQHVMLMGVKAPMIDGGTLTLTLIFEKAGAVTVDAPIVKPRQGGTVQKNVKKAR